MAKFLTTVGNSFYIEQIILNTERKLTLVTPYLNLSKNLIERLTDADREDIKITLIYGKNELNKSEKNKINSLKNIEIYYCENLHAKCYLNEKSLIITSMNLYEFSERNNREMGILFDKNIDIQIFNDTLKEIESIKNSSELQKVSEKKDLSDLISLSEDKIESWNFYYPSLYKVLKYKLQDFKVIYNDDKIVIESCPVKGVQIVINNRIDFNFDNNTFYYFFRDNYNNKFEKILPKLRFYWNYCLNIYLEKEFVSEVNQQGLEEIIKKYYEIITKTTELITIAYRDYNNKV